MEEGMTNQQYGKLLETLAKLIESQAKTPEETTEIVREAKTNTKENTLMEKTFAEQLKEARKAAGLTQKTMVEHTLIPRRTLEDWERGINEPAEYIKRLILNELESLKNERKETRVKISMKKLLGYDYVDGKLVINDDGSKIVKFIFEKNEEYTKHPPKELVDKVLAIAQEKGKTLTYEEAEARVSYTAILEYIGKEIYEVPEFKETLDKLEETHKANVLYGTLRKERNKASINMTPIISKEIFELAKKINLEK